MEGLGVAVEAEERMPNCSRSPRGRATEVLRAAMGVLSREGCGLID
jgi:hypothetical protein